MAPRGGEEGGPLRAPMDSWEAARHRLVEELRALGIRDERVLEAIRTIPRHEFVPEPYREHAYENRPLPIDEGQTISQPYIVALMTEALRLSPEDRVLEIGTGSGYQTAILASLAAEVYTIERFPSLLEGARARLEALGFHNIHYKCGDGTVGWPEFAPYNAIIATGSVPRVPPSLKEQLADGGRLVIPVGGRHFQTLKLVERRGDAFVERDLCECSFLPLIGAEGWPPEYAEDPCGPKSKPEDDGALR